MPMRRFTEAFRQAAPPPTTKSDTSIFTADKRWPMDHDTLLSKEHSIGSAASRKFEV